MSDIVYTSQKRIDQKDYSHLVFEELVGSGAATADPKYWVNPKNKKFPKVTIHKDPSGYAMVVLKSEGKAYPPELVGGTYTSARAAARHINEYLATQ